ncbi:MarR family transcriptional regulator [Thomasclavelia cocleata]|uniref:MarR family transcriptional regulator n=2 Tax=Thomasclavelia cocleata TaxID=69824 RepID=UPI0033AF38D2
MEYLQLLISMIQKFLKSKAIIYVAQIDNKNVGLNKTEKKVIELLIDNPSLTSIELAEQISVTKRTIERTFKSLQEKKMIDRIGSRRDGNWIVVR